MNKGFPAIIILAILATLGLSMAVSQNKLPISNLLKSISAPNNVSSNRPEFVSIPPEHQIFRDYLEAIGATIFTQKEEFKITATIVSLRKVEVCPDKRLPTDPEITNCSIPPYPKDAGIIRIDRIEKTTPSPTASEAKTDQKSPISNILTKPSPSFLPLKIGQEVDTVFTLTAQPAKVRYASLSDSEVTTNSEKAEGYKAQGSGSVETGAGSGNRQTVGKSLGTMPKIYKPLPKEGGYFILVTKIGNYPQGIEKVFDGLKVGDKFEATILYNGTVFVGEYQKL